METIVALLSDDEKFICSSCNTKNNGGYLLSCQSISLYFCTNCAMKIGRTLLNGVFLR